MPLVSLLSKKHTLTLIVICLISIGFTNCVYASTANFKKAVTLYNNHHYEQAYTLFSALVEQDYSSIEYSFYLAQAATKIHKNQAAITAYERILILQPNHTRAKLELGKIYYDQGDYILAKQYFTDAKKDEVPKNVKANINQYLDQIEHKTQKSKLTGSVILGMGHDDNINISPEASSWFVPIFGQNFNNTSDPVASLYTEQTAMLTHLYNGNVKYGFDIKNNLMLYNRSIPGESAYNIFYLRYQPSLVFTKKQYAMEATLQYDTMRYGGDAYLESYGFVPKISHVINATSVVSAQIKLLVKNYLRRRDQQRDARYNEVNANYIQKLTQNTTWLNSIHLAQERQDQKSLLDVSNDSWNIKTSIYHQISPSLQVNSELQYSQKNYLDNNVYFLNKRLDSTLNAAIGLTKTVNKDMAIQLRAEHTETHSNQQAYTYSKNVLLVNLVRRF